eukprot:6515745-Prymnesium_polylepis.1
MWNCRRSTHLTAEGHMCGAGRWGIDDGLCPRLCEPRGDKLVGDRSQRASVLWRLAAPGRPRARVVSRAILMYSESSDTHLTPPRPAPAAPQPTAQHKRQPTPPAQRLVTFLSDYGGGEK